MSQTNKKRDFYFSTAIGVHQNFNLGEFQSVQKTTLKIIAENIDSGNRAFFEESSAGTSIDISFGGVLDRGASYYIEGAFSFVMSQTKEASSVVTDSSAEQTQVILNHKFNQRLLVMRARYFRKLWSSFHLGLGLGLGNGYSSLGTSTDVSFFGSNTTSKKYSGSGLTYELTAHLKYIPSFTERFSFLFNIGFRELRVGELEDKSTNEPLADRFGNNVNFNFSTLYASLEARFLF